MPQTKSALKKMRVDERRRVDNLRRKRLVKQLIKKAQETKAVDTVRAAISQIDKATKQHIFPKNRAARIKSSLAKLIAGKTAKVAAASKPVKKTAAKNPKPASKAKPKAAKSAKPTKTKK